MITLWLIRHGQTDWNVEGRYQGQSDTPLNETGLAQAEALQNRLDGIEPDAVYSSHLQRARRTAEFVAQRYGLPVQEDRRLREVGLGDWEGMLFTDIKTQYPQELENRKRDPLRFRPPGGETVEELAQRARAFLDEVHDKYPAGQVVIVSHGLTLGVIKCLSSGIPLSEAAKHIPDNAAPEQAVWPPA